MEFSSDRFKKLAGIITEQVDNSPKQLKEDWDNYQSLEEIEQKYLLKIMLVFGMSATDDRLPAIREIFKTALEDAKMLGSLNPPTPDSF